MLARLIGRSLWQRKSQVLVALTALSVASTLTASLVNLYLDARGKVASEFRRYGANLMLTPRAGSDPGAPKLLEAKWARELEDDLRQGRLTAVAPYLYAVVELEGESVVLAGTWLDQFNRLGAFEREAGTPPSMRGPGDVVWLGTRVARRFSLQPGDSVLLRYRDGFGKFRVAGILATGAAEDNQILAALDAVQALTAASGKLNAILVRAAGESAAIEQTAAELAGRFPGAAVSPLRQVTQSEYRVVDRIRWALLGTTLVVLVVTALCVLATMTALAFERRQTIGTLKALGATEERLAALFLGEAAALALLASGVGFLAGMWLTRWLGGTLFAAPVSLRWATLPLVAAVSVAVAVVGTLLPLRLVRQIQPAVILRGE